VAEQQFVAGLSGQEIINDVLGQVRKALERDCNVRESDCYGRGYSGSIKLSLQLFDIDVAKIEMELPLTPTKELLASTPETPEDVDGQDVKVDVDLEIPMTTDLTAVRERSNQNEPPAPEVPVDPTVPAPVVPQRRTYGKPPTLGGAVDVTD
jgi:hypothetical protein